MGDGGQATAHHHFPQVSIHDDIPARKEFFESDDNLLPALKQIPPTHNRRHACSALMENKLHTSK